MSTISRVLLLCFCVAGLAVEDAPTQTALPRAEVELLRFVAYQAGSADMETHARVRENAQVLISLQTGLELVRSYHEPILTRGVRGVALFRSASPAVVLVTVGRVNARGEYDVEGIGSGAIVDSRGFVLTNWHVVTGYGQTGIITKPTAADNPSTSEVLVGTVIAQDLAKDLALIRIQDARHAFPFLQLGDLSEVEVAGDIHIIGHPRGELWSYTTGVISQIRAGYEWTYSDNSRHLARVLQLQTAINPGNSGGPVLNDAGHLIGLIAMATSGQNLDYAVAIDEIRSFLNLNLPARTRGAASRSPQRPPTTTARDIAFSIAQLHDGNTVTRGIGNGVASYVVTDKNGSPEKALVVSGSRVVRSDKKLTAYSIEGSPELHGETNARSNLEIVKR
jgi:S1-C subfamily serine protease